VPPKPLPPLPGVDPATAPAPDDPDYSDWLERVAFNEAGVDRMQIWERLHQTPDERLEGAEKFSREISVLRDGFAAARRQ
jgi:hypothetical protein